MRKVFVEIDSAEEKTHFDAVLNRDGKKSVIVSDEFRILSDDAFLSVERLSEPKYSLSFESGRSFSAPIVTPYGVCDLSYTVFEFDYKESESGFCCDVLYGDGEWKNSVKISVELKEEV